jgi:hypothetical protein
VGTSKVDDTIPGSSHASVGTVIAGSAPRIITPTDPPPATQNVWNQVTVGSPATSVLASEPASVTSFSLAASLYQIGSGPDAFSMLAQPVYTDVSAIARITIPAGSSNAAEGLVTFRESAATNSAFVSVGVTETGQVNFQWRCWDGADVYGYSFPAGTSPLWVKLIKAGNLVQAYFSGDGLSWQYVGEIGVLFGSSNYLVGLASLSNTLTGAPVVFDNVSIPAE